MCIRDSSKVVETIKAKKWQSAHTKFALIPPGTAIDIALESGLGARQDTPMASHALAAGSLRPGFLCASVLREAPALGMAARALEEPAAV